MNGKYITLITIGLFSVLGALAGVVLKYRYGFTGFTLGPGELGAAAGALIGSILVNILKKS